MDAVEHLVIGFRVFPQVDQLEVSVKDNGVLVHGGGSLVLERVHYQLRERHEEGYGDPQAKEGGESVWEKLVIDVRPGDYPEGESRAERNGGN